MTRNSILFFSLLMRANLTYTSISCIMISCIAPKNVYAPGIMIVSPGARLVVDGACVVNGTVATCTNMTVMRGGANMFGPLALLGCACAPSITDAHAHVTVTDIARNLSLADDARTETIPTTGACAKYMRAGPDTFGRDLLCCAYHPSMSVAHIECARERIDVLARVEVSTHSACALGKVAYCDEFAQVCARVLAGAPKVAGMIVELRDITYISTPNLTWFAIDVSGRDVGAC